MTRDDVLVKVGDVWMNRHCHERNAHPPEAAGACQYCRVCEHGRTECEHCGECNADESWRDDPITDAEIEWVLAVLEKDWYCKMYPQRQPNEKRYYNVGVPLVPLAVAKMRAMLRAARGAE